MCGLKLQSIYWKPSLKWIVDEVRIVNSIIMESKGIRPLDYIGGNFAYLLEAFNNIENNHIRNECDYWTS